MDVAVTSWLGNQGATLAETDQVSQSIKINQALFSSVCGRFDDECLHLQFNWIGLVTKDSLTQFTCSGKHLWSAGREIKVKTVMRLCKFLTVATERRDYATTTSCLTFSLFV